MNQFYNDSYTNCFLQDGDKNFLLSCFVLPLLFSLKANEDLIAGVSSSFDM
ncbi:hypothetical protein PROVRETT_09406 [Providencia rettgeri DSM 1131]|nr:hypothetical protein PROVRETT_09406 [Providencia rettgeri DSM 1131]